jgi:hypothetical protein
MRPRAPQPATTTALHTVLAHVPDNRLRQLMMILLGTLAGAPMPWPIVHSQRRAPRSATAGFAATVAASRSPTSNPPVATDRVKASALAAIDEKLAARPRRGADARRAAARAMGRFQYHQCDMRFWPRGHVYGSPLLPRQERRGDLAANRIQQISAAGRSIRAAA